MKFLSVCALAIALVLPATSHAKPWHYTLLHNFCTQGDCADGNFPTAGLVADSALSYAGKNSGALYDGVSPLFGTTASGGANGHGTAFSLAPAGKLWTLSTLYALGSGSMMEKTIHTFCADCSDGEGPWVPSS